MFFLNIQFIAGILALFFITLAIYKALSQRASKRASAAKSLAQSHVGQDSEVSLHNPFPNGAPIPAPQPPSDEKPQPQPVPPPPPTPPPGVPDSQTATTTVAALDSTSKPAGLSASTSPEQIYKWN